VSGLTHIPDQGLASIVALGRDQLKTLGLANTAAAEMLFRALGSSSWSSSVVSTTSWTLQALDVSGCGCLQHRDAVKASAALREFQAALGRLRCLTGESWLCGYMTIRMTERHFFSVHIYADHGAVLNIVLPQLYALLPVIFILIVMLF
jgi:hypothetical protein